MIESWGSFPDSFVNNPTGSVLAPRRIGLIQTRSVAWPPAAELFVRRKDLAMECGSSNNLTNMGHLERTITPKAALEVKTGFVTTRRCSRPGKMNRGRF